MTAELRVSIFSSEVEIAVPSELSGAPLRTQGGSVRMRAEYADVARTLTRLIEMLGPQMHGECLIKLAVHDRTGLRIAEAGSSDVALALSRARTPTES